MASIFTKLRKTGDESNSSFFHKKWIFKNIPSLKFNQEIFRKRRNKMKGRTKKPAPFKCWFLYLIKVVTIKLKFKIVKIMATR